MCLLYGVSYRVVSVNCYTATEGYVSVFGGKLKTFYVLIGLTLFWMSCLMRFAMNTAFRRVFIFPLLALCLLSPANLNAGFLDSIFGYSSYEECILDKMEGITNNAAAYSIRKACKKLTDGGGEKNCSDLTTLEQRQGVTGQGTYFGKSYSVDLYNPKRNLIVSSIEVRVVGVSNGRKFERELILNGSPIPPLSSGTLYGNLGITPSEITSWYLTAVYGCEQ